MSRFPPVFQIVQRRRERFITDSVAQGAINRRTLLAHSIWGKLTMIV
jgi:hypothetical protein